MSELEKLRHMAETRWNTLIIKFEATPYETLKGVGVRIFDDENRQIFSGYAENFTQLCGIINSAILKVNQ